MRTNLLPGLVALALISVGCHITPLGAPVATATVRDATGQSLGTLNLSPTSDGARMVGTLSGLQPGVHGIHFHSVGQCDAPGFTSAGGHFNPAGRHHGLENPAGPHAGDLPNIVVPASGVVTVDLVSPRVTLDGASSTGLFDADGSAIVVHAMADDQRSDPAGNSGARVACGVVGRS